MMLNLMILAALQAAPVLRTPAEIAAEVAQPQALARLVTLQDSAEAPATLERIEVRRRIGRTEVLLRGTGAVAAELSVPHHHTEHTRLFVTLPNTRVAEVASTHGAADDGRVLAINAHPTEDGAAARVAIDMAEVGRYGQETWGSTTLVWIEEPAAAAGDAPAAGAGARHTVAAMAEHEGTGSARVEEGGSTSGPAQIVALLRSRLHVGIERAAANPLPVALGLGLAITCIGGGAGILAMRRRRRRAHANVADSRQALSVARALADRGASIVEIARATGLARDAATLALYRRRPVEIAGSGKAFRARGPRRPGRRLARSGR